MEPVKVAAVLAAPVLKNAPEHEPRARDDILVGPQWLQAHLYDAAVRVVEVDVSRLAEYRVYDGSWAEWGRMTGTPVAT